MGHRLRAGLEKRSMSAGMEGEGNMDRKWLTLALAIALVAALIISGAVISGKSRDQTELETRLNTIITQRDAAQTAAAVFNTVRTMIG